MIKQLLLYSQTSWWLWVYVCDGDGCSYEPLYTSEGVGTNSIHLGVPKNGAWTDWFALGEGSGMGVAWGGANRGGETWWAVSTSRFRCEASFFSSFLGGQLFLRHDEHVVRISVCVFLSFFLFYSGGCGDSINVFFVRVWSIGNGCTYSNVWWTRKK